MNRRSFLRGLVTAAVAAPIARTYFFAPAAGWGVSESGLSYPTGLAYPNNGGELSWMSRSWANKTPEQITAEVDAALRLQSDWYIDGKTVTFSELIRRMSRNPSLT